MNDWLGIAAGLGMLIASLIYLGLKIARVL